MILVEGMRTHVIRAGGAPRGRKAWSIIGECREGMEGREGLHTILPLDMPFDVTVGNPCLDQGAFDLHVHHQLVLDQPLKQLGV